MNKLSVLSLLCALLCGCSDGSDNDRADEAPAWTNDPAVQLVDGPVLGLADTIDTWAWKAIPYAAPPVGELRWKAPQAPASWTDAISSAEYGSVCTQYSQTWELIGSEDCLTLNVWRPQTQEQKLPVYVWIHGGGNTVGSGGEPATEGANLAARSNVVYVSINYRLGPFGWFYNEALGDGNPDTDSGNFGTLDIIQSLQWVQDNIERFGGDPENVVIAGESGGGLNVLSLLVSPRASGLFHKAVSQSALQAEVDLEAAARFFTGVLPDILVAAGQAADNAEAQALLTAMTPEDLREVLVAANPASLMSPIPRVGFGLLAMPILFSDGHVIVENGADSFSAGNYPNKVPLILGTNSGDVRLFLYSQANELTTDMELYNTIADIGGMLWKAEDADDIARAITDFSDQPDVYVYSFEWGHYATDGSAVTPDPFNYWMGAAHSIDIPFFLDTLDAEGQLTGLLFTEENRPGRELLSDQMIGYLQNFIRTGNPNGDGLQQEWYSWSNAEGAPKSIVFDASLSELRLRVDYEGVSKQLALDAIEALPDPDLRQRVKDFLFNFQITCTLLSDNPGADCGSD